MLSLSAAFPRKSLPCSLIKTWLQIYLKFTVALPTEFYLKVTWYSAAIVAEQFFVT